MMLADAIRSRKAITPRPCDPPADGPRCLVVMYHYIRDPDGQTQSGIRGLTSGEFRHQLDRLCTDLEPTDWPTLHTWMQARREPSSSTAATSIPNRSFILTFDDGLADHAETVLPILQERGLQGTFFVPGAALAEQRMLPAHAIHLLLSALGDEELERAILDYVASSLSQPRAAGDQSEGVIDTTAADRMYHYEPPARARLKYLLTMTLPLPVRRQAVDALFARHVGSSAEWSRRWYLSRDQLVKMQSLGHTIGGHGYEHEPFARLDAAHRRSDMRRVAALLSATLGPAARPLSYPYGSFNDDTRAACREAGFVYGFGTQSHWLTAESDPFALPRVDTIHVNALIAQESSWIERA